MIIGLQETLKLVESQVKEVERHLDSRAEFHPADVSILNGLKPEDRQNVYETLQAVSLEKLIREYLGASGTTGVAGAAYLIPDKVYDIMYKAASWTDVAPLCSPVVSCPGSSLKIDVEVDGQFKAHYASGGGQMPDETIETKQVTITPVLFNVKPRITNELIEDSAFDLMELHLTRAAQEMGELSSKMFIRDLITGTDGDGTQNTLTTADATGHFWQFKDISNAWSYNYADKYLSDTVLLPPKAFSDLLFDGSVSAYSNDFHTRAINDPPLQMANAMGMKFVVVPGQGTTTDYTGDGALYISSHYHGFVLDSRNAMLTVRKRWLKIEKFSDPVRDLVGAVVTSRQDQASIYNDASCEITEG